jgi:tRNA(Ile)-lysidine synthase
MTDILQNIRDTIEKYGMLNGAESVLLGYSGGADSSVLLRCLNQLQSEYGFKLYAVHVNHNIRGAEAVRDMNFCIDTCAELGVELYTASVDVPLVAEMKKLSLEEAARIERYAVFDNLCAAHGIGKVATAHNAGDNFETVILNMTRGAALKGLCGIPPVRGNIIRPLISCSKTDIIDYCTAGGVRYVTDTTNADLSYTRNFIRSEIIPKLKEVNPSADQTVLRMCEQLRAANDYLDGEADKINNGNITDFDDVIISRYLIKQYQSACGEDSGYIENKHIKTLIESVRNGSPTSMSLPGNITFFRETVSFKKAVDEVKPPEKVAETELRLGENIFADKNFAFLLTHNEKDIKPHINIYNLFKRCTVDFDKIKGYIYFRNRKNGDRYRFGGITRNIKKLLCDNKIPVDERDGLPFICDSGGIVWIPGFRVRDDVKPEENSVLLHVAFYKKIKNGE